MCVFVHVCIECVCVCERGREKMLLFVAVSMNVPLFICFFLCVCLSKCACESICVFVHNLDPNSRDFAGLNLACRFSKPESFQ